MEANINMQADSVPKNDTSRAWTSVLLRTISGETRLRIVESLQAGEQNVGDLCKLTGQKQSALSHHLAILRFSGVVDSRRQKKHVFYSLTGIGRNLVSLVASALELETTR